MGLTPGWTQMEEAFRAVKQGLARGLEGEALFQYVETTGSFSGPMRNNLVSMLDGIGLNNCLKISSCKELFDLENPSRYLVHFTSAVSAPIFKNNQNYRGYAPPLLQVPKLREWVLSILAAELCYVQEAVIVALGRIADEVIRFLQTASHPGLVWTDA